MPERSLLTSWRRTPLITAGAVLIVGLALAALSAPWLASADPAHQFDIVAGKQILPGAQRYVLEFADNRLPQVAEEVVRRGDQLEITRSGRQRTFAEQEIANLTAEGLPPQRTFLLGTDRLSRDLWARLLYGGRISLVIGFLAALLALVLGVLVGSLAASGGRLVDAVLMRLVDTFLTIPPLFILLALVSLLSPGIEAIILLLGGTSWMTISRLVRAEILSLKERDFVRAAHGLGQHPLRVLLRHILPNALTPALVQTGLLVGNMILTESALSFLSFGVPEPASSWGKMVADVTGGPIDLWWMAVFPGSAIILTVIAFNLVTDGLRDALDPRRQRL
ncbi:MAG: ABC transporter permease [Acidobacteriota bacterium]